jgi:hypothetical protein
MIDYPKFIKMQKKFQGKMVSTLDGKMVIDVKTIDVKMNVMDVNVVARSKITKKHVLGVSMV